MHRRLAVRRQADASGIERWLPTDERTSNTRLLSPWQQKPGGRLPGAQSLENQEKREEKGRRKGEGGEKQEKRKGKRKGGEEKKEEKREGDLPSIAQGGSNKATRVTNVRTNERASNLKLPPPW